VPPFAREVQESDGVRVFVLNLMTEPGETEGFGAAEHLRVVSDHLGFQPFDYVIFNTAPVPPHLAEAYATRGAVPVVVNAADIASIREMGAQAIGAPLACEGPVGRVRHHPGRLAAAITACAKFIGRPPAGTAEGTH
jgi:2-phospho-L-lactate transferase/gluconeogenesis factor (CofD/UPF0052 family)